MKKSILWFRGSLNIPLKGRLAGQMITLIQGIKIKINKIRLQYLGDNLFTRFHLYASRTGDGNANYLHCC